LTRVVVGVKIVRESHSPHANIDSSKFFLSSSLACSKP
jgi:hypothetical protein